MLNICIRRGEEKARKGITSYIHYSAIVRKRKVCSESLNKYNNSDNTHHAEEAALLRGDSKWREKGGYCSLRGSGSVRV